MYVVLKEPLVAPLKKGQKINGHLVIEKFNLTKETGKKKKIFFPLEVNEDLERGGLTNKLRTNFGTLKYKFFSLFRSN